ncbi:MAG: signal peptidase I [Solirubrobacterales bacterium]|nr:signal peptidase I [Solirubrobacterales bacterium]
MAGIAAVCVFIAGCGGDAGTPRQTATKYLQSIQSGNAVQYCQLLAPNLQTRLTRAGKNDCLAAAKYAFQQVAPADRSPFTGFHVTGASISGTRAAVTLSTSKSGVPLTEHMSEVREGNSWKVSSPPGHITSGGELVIRVPSGSMTPTLKVNQNVLMSRHAANPELGDIVVFHPPQGADAQKCAAPTAHGQACDRSAPEDRTQEWIKRVVGLPGDHLQIRNGNVWRNGTAEHEPYAQPCPGGSTQGCDFPKTIVVPAGQYYVLGDNRPDSDDSRYWGPIPKAWLIGKVTRTL